MKATLPPSHCGILAQFIVTFSSMFEEVGRYAVAIETRFRR